VVIGSLLLRLPLNQERPRLCVGPGGKEELHWRTLTHLAILWRGQGTVKWAKLIQLVSFWRIKQRPTKRWNVWMPVLPPKNNGARLL